MHPAHGSSSMTKPGIQLDHVNIQMMCGKFVATPNAGKMAAVVFTPFRSNQVSSRQVRLREQHDSIFAISFQSRGKSLAEAPASAIPNLHRT
jgi:hypothetical protein